MRFRKLRIAWSVVCTVACVLLIVLWDYSYWYIYTAIRLISPTACVSPAIIEGQFELNWTSDPLTVSLVTRNGSGWTGGSKSLEDYYWEMTQGDEESVDGPHPFGSPVLRRFAFENRLIVIPLWFVAAIFATFAASPWIRWSKRFALRTLLIATTLVAIVLGLIVAVLRWPAG